MAAGDESSKGSAYNCAPWDSNFEQNKPLYRSERVILSSKTTADAGSSQEMIRYNCFMQFCMHPLFQQKHPLETAWEAH